MALSLKHVFASGKSDGVDVTLVQPSGWNQEHALTMATARIVGRTTAGGGNAEEISIGTGLAMAAGVLSMSTTPAFTTMSVSGVATFGAGKTIDGSGNATLTSLALSGTASIGNAITLTGTTLTISLVETDSVTRSIYQDGSVLGFRTSAGTWAWQTDNNGNCTALANITAYSDARLKTNIHTIPDALDLVWRMRGVHYQRIDSGDFRVGLIAQEVRDVVPQAVLEDGQGMLSVSYGDLVGVLIQAVNELTARVIELEKRQ